MGKKLVIPAVAMMLLVIGFGGWKVFSESNYVTVIVDSVVCLIADDGSGLEAPVGAALANITIDKVTIDEDSDENVQYDEITDAGGCTVHVLGTFKVYEEQFVSLTVKLTTLSIPEGMADGTFNPDTHPILKNTKTLTWNDISATVMGGTFNWYPTVRYPCHLSRYES